MQVEIDQFGFMRVPALLHSFSIRGNGNKQYLAQKHSNGVGLTSVCIGND